MSFSTRRSKLARVAFLLLVAQRLCLAADPRILLVRSSAPLFADAQKGMQETLGPGWDLTIFEVGKESTAQNLSTAWEGLHPQVVVAMDNRSISLAKDVRMLRHDTTTPLLGMMGVRVDLALQNTPNSIGIGYEIPAVTSFVNLRSLVQCRIKKVGVLYRPLMADLVKINAEICQKENLEIVGVEKILDEGQDPEKLLREGLHQLLDKENVDALWVLNDNKFLNPSLIKEVWIPLIAHSGKPVVVGIEAFMQSSIAFGTFALVPDTYGLGSQAAGILQDLQDQDWKVTGTKFVLPLSVVKILSRSLMESKCNLAEDRLNEMDKILR